MRYKYSIPLSSIRRVMEKAGAKRVSDEALKEMETQVEEFIAERTRAALVVMTTSGRTTLKARDIRAVKNIMG